MTTNNGYLPLQRRGGRHYAAEICGCLYAHSLSGRLVNGKSLFLLHLEIASPVRATQSRIIGVVRGAHFQLWGTIFPVCSPYAPRKYDKRFGTPAIV